MIDYALAERLHGHLAVLALAVLLHPVVTLRTRRVVTRGTKWTTDLAALLLSAPFVAGLLLYPSYRGEVKGGLLASAPAAAAAFEAKEHLAVMAVALVIAGAVVVRAAGRRPEGRRAAWALLAAGWACGALTGALGIWVASKG
jgi:hypothetical protein